MRKIITKIEVNMRLFLLFWGIAVLLSGCTMNPGIHRGYVISQSYGEVEEEPPSSESP